MERQSVPSSHILPIQIIVCNSLSYYIDLYSIYCEFHYGIGYDGMIRQQNLLTTATPTVYDFIAGSYILLGNDQKKWQQTPSAMDNSDGVNRLLVSIMKINVSRCIFLPSLNRLCCLGFCCFISIRT